MQFTDIFIKRPVLATVVSLLIFLLGLRAIFALQVRQFPDMKNTVVTITTTYPGASSEIVQGFITTIIQRAVAGADGIDYLTSSSTQGQSQIKAYIKLNYDPNAAFTDIMSKVAQTRNQLPREAFDPVLQKDTGQQIALMYIGFSSPEMTAGQITDYLIRVVQPKIQTIDGVSSADILGGQTFAMRIWLNSAAMAARNVTADDVNNAIAMNNFQSAPGTTKGEFVAFNINAATDLKSAEGFGNMVVKNDKGDIVRLKDIAQVELGAQSYDSSVFFDGEKAVFMGIKSTPVSNPLTVISKITNIFPELQKDFPPMLHGAIVYDATKYIRASIHEVVKTIIEATVIVVVVIYLFLGALRSVTIPVVTIPLSLIGVCSLMLMFGYSINLLTLLAMVLAIGLVVDDAIVVVENIYRHIEEGASPFEAAIQGTREIAVPIISMTLTLAAVYAPIGFIRGLTGSLFREFALTLAGTVIVSGVIALTLSPMMCSKILRAEIGKGRFVTFLDRLFHHLKESYQKKLYSLLNYRPVVLLFAATVLVSCYFLYSGAMKELAPDEDQSVLFMAAQAPQYANIDYVEAFTSQFNKIFESFPETKDYFIINGSDGVATTIAGIILKPWNERKRSQMTINPLVQEKVDQVAGLQTVVFPLPSLPTTDNTLPIQFVVNTTGDYSQLYEVSNELLREGMKSGLFIFLDNTLRYNKPLLQIDINRDKAAQLGISMQDIGDALSTAMGGNYVNFFGVSGQSYQVIPQMLRNYRLNPSVIENYYVTTANGQMVPLSTVVTINQSVEPNARTQFQQLNSATLQGLVAPGQTIGTALTFLAQKADKLLPNTMNYDYAGQSRQYIQEGSALIVTFFFAIIIIFLVLAAQFESFRDPLIVLISVPMSICGALIPLYLGAATINIYTQIGLITLIGLISKHGILMTDFANKLQMHEGLNKHDAIIKAAAIRLRPILMTTAAMVVGVIPLLLADGAGAKSRFDIGLVIATGMSIGTIFTLFVVPTMYTLLARDHSVRKKA